jgi:hypothetical protein
MQANADVLRRLDRLERSLRRARGTTLALGVARCATLASGFATAGARFFEEIRTTRLVVVDDAGVPRVVIGQDPVETERMSRAAGITIYDEKGDVRGGFCTFADGSVVLALDAPVGVGAAMRDRLGMKVYASGAADFMVIDNQTRAIAKMYSDGSGGGGLQACEWDHDGGKIRVKTFGVEGDVVETYPLGEPK